MQQKESTSWVVQARGPANVNSFLLIFSFRKAIKVNRAMSWKQKKSKMMPYGSLMEFESHLPNLSEQTKELTEK